MKTFRQLVESISHFPSTFTTIYDYSSIESFGTPLENHRNTIPASADFYFQETRDCTTQSVGEFTPHPPQAAFLCESHRHTNHQTVIPRPINSQPIPIGPVYKPNRESLGTYLNPRTPPTTPQKSVTLWRLIICSSKSIFCLHPQYGVLIEGQAPKIQFLGKPSG